MAPNLTLWTQLEACGVTEAHLEALLRFLRCQRNGAFAWRGRNGYLEQCELQLVFPGKPIVVTQVIQAVCAEAREEDGTDAACIVPRKGAY